MGWLLVVLGPLPSTGVLAAELSLAVDYTSEVVRRVCCTCALEGVTQVDDAARMHAAPCSVRPKHLTSSPATAALCRYERGRDYIYSDTPHKDNGAGLFTQVSQVGPWPLAPGLWPRPLPNRREHWHFCGTCYLPALTCCLCSPVRDPFPLQLVWKSTTSIGCGVRIIDEKVKSGWDSYTNRCKIIVCFFAPAGNIVSDRAFEENVLPPVME